MKKVAITLSAMMIIGLSVGMLMQQEPMTSLPAQTQSEKLAEQVQETEQQEQEPVIPVTDQPADYSINDEEFLVTFDQGENWIQVPIEPQTLFTGEYTGSQEELINDSYVLTKDRAVFLYAVHQTSGITVHTISTTDQGKSWQETPISNIESRPTLRFRTMDLLNEKFGYLIFSGERTMSSESGYVYLTNDGGESWTLVGIPDTIRLIAGGGFINETTGFLSYGTINPDAPDLYVTNDAGTSWTSADIHVPEEYGVIFVQAEVPFIRDNQMVLHVNQGPNGDYLGGRVKGEFHSEDEGLTWKFVKEVEPDELP
ncbi:WD40/YVTN/BNR-like repeat-containing protein [Alkalicoccobacillus porphyridii]|uniref:Oxidoreductase n=1 Tax=Alkalicoccobacillus porphyridii TaxID=2597270 RepID=A0A554A3H5_9BACI|nr:oxidoreductase [Alkalicoccobacillus porphyridii]TSB48235.1 oxidoreductase [Alkalicoccobacillus porphyridii]